MGLAQAKRGYAGNYTTKQTPTACRQAIFGPPVVVRRHDEGDVIEIEPAGICRRFSKVVVSGGKIKGSARVHPWTPHKTHRPHTILLPSNTDFWEGELLGRALINRPTDFRFRGNSNTAELVPRPPPVGHLRTNRRPSVSQ